MKYIRNNKKVVNLIIAIIFVGLFVNYYANNPEIIENLGSFKFSTLAIGGLLTLVNMLSLSSFLKFIIDHLARRIPFFESFYTTLLSTLANYVLPFRGGAGVRALYLKNEYGLAYKDFIASLYGNYILILLINSAFALIGLLFIGRASALNYSLYLVLGGFFIFALSLTTKKIRLDDFVLWMLSKIPFKVAKVLSTKISEVLVGWKAVISNKKLLSQMIAVIVVNFFARLALFGLLFNAFDLHVPLSVVVLFSAITNLTIFVAVTPGALGIRETVLLIYSQTFGLSIEDVLSISLADRAITLGTVTFLAGMTGLYRLIFMRRNKDTSISDSSEE